MSEISSSNWTLFSHHDIGETLFTCVKQQSLTHPNFMKDKHKSRIQLYNEHN
jgi:hypothetical protein